MGDAINQMNPGKAAILPDEIEIADQSRLDLRRMWAAVYRNRLMIIATIAISLLIGLLVTMFTTPIYQAYATIQIDPRNAQVLSKSADVEPDIDGGTAAEERFLKTAVDVIRSRALAERVAESLKLYTSNTFFQSMQMPEPAANPSGLAGVSEQRRRAVLSALMSSLEVQPSRESRIVSLNVSSPDNRLATEIANAYAQNAISYNLQQKVEVTAYARKFLEEELATAKLRLEDSERAAIAYAREAGLLDLNITKASDKTSNSTAQSLVSGNLLAINEALSAATGQRIAAQERYVAARTSPTSSLPEVQGNPTVQSLIRDRAALQANYAQMAERRQSEFPEMRQIRAQIGELDSQIAQISKGIVGGLKQNYDFAVRQEDELRGQLNALRSTALSEQERSVRYNILRRDADTNRSLYDSLLQRYREVSTVAGMSAANVVLLDSAQVPTAPISPRPLINLLVALLAGTAIAVALVYLRETFDDAVRSPEEVEEKLGTQFLGAIPKLQDDETPFEQLDDRLSAFSESYLALRSVLSFSTAEGLPKVILCTSSLPSEGKSTTAIALARSFAAIGKKTLLIDGDLRKPTVHFALELPREPGFSNVIVDRDTFAQAVHTEIRPNLDVLTCGTMPPNPAELFGGELVAGTIDLVADKYDVVILDGPPVMGLADGPLLASIADGTLLVVEAGRGHRGQTKVAIRRLRANNARIIGAVLTKFDARQSGYGYSYEYSYAYTYHYGHQAKERARSFWPWSKNRK
ncbi:GumC family protein [Novosphingobium album (ex Liu et al. 2023)]|uniref:non-specific protein-tyrosine kinase n=1 Tax=Novosphingobium album (ex Liu et al. 2023) TaxID=3031130 RepID=A0ABT5WK97_9SPHN|nr:polysaccharide biosynthesis tyrosine autokinase [Novosphingobium album (ex Liu et al. 2023)]MDE8650475.1 polysaccharide biosynthesis tyrosine autokinase [Novosphingobium album (ex Liu et al. 2023)]